MKSMCCLTTFCWEYQLPPAFAQTCHGGRTNPVDLTMSCTHESQEFFGVDPSFDNPFLRWLEQYKDLNARDGFHLINGYGKQMPVPSVKQACRVAPQTNIADKPDAFSDRSSTHPKMPQFGLATAAVWWPGRSLLTCPLTQLEQAYCHLRELQGGVAIATHFGRIQSIFNQSGVVGTYTCAALAHLL